VSVAHASDKQRTGAHEDVRLEYRGRLAHLAPAEAVRLPANLVETVVEPVRDIRAGPAPALVGEVRDVDLEDGPAVDDARRRGVELWVRVRRAYGRQRRWVRAIVGLVLGLRLRLCLCLCRRRRRRGTLRKRGGLRGRAAFARGVFCRERWAGRGGCECERLCAWKIAEKGCTHAFAG
jgi:hypothetical protein